MSNETQTKAYANYNEALKVFKEVLTSNWMSLRSNDTLEDDWNKKHYVFKSFQQVTKENWIEIEKQIKEKLWNKMTFSCSYTKLFWNAEFSLLLFV